MTEREAFAREIAGDHYGLSLEGDRSYLNGRLTEDERGAFDAGWEAAKQFYTTGHAEIAERMRPTGGRQWTDEQLACFNALTDCAANIRAYPNVQNQS